MHGKPNRRAVTFAAVLDKTLSDLTSSQGDAGALQDFEGG
jgi:hypothetical protein